MSTPESGEEIHTVPRTQSVEPATASSPDPSQPLNPGPEPNVTVVEVVGVDVGGGQSHATSDESVPINTIAHERDSRSQSKLCGVCHENESKYKCARCLVPYCSVVCSTTHRATHSTVNDEEMSNSPTPQEQPVSLNGQPTPTPAPLATSNSGNPFAVLEASQELKTLFMMYPRLRSQLREIYGATLPPLEAATTSHYDDSYQSHQRGRGGRGRGPGGINGRGRGGRHHEAWNSDRGTQNGIDAISAAKNEYGKGGEGIMEYASLVLKLVSTKGIDVAKLVHEEASEENAKIIAELLNGESY